MNVVKELSTHVKLGKVYYSDEIFQTIQIINKEDLSLTCSAWKSFVFVSIPESLVLSDLVFSP